MLAEKDMEFVESKVTHIFSFFDSISADTPFSKRCIKLIKESSSSLDNVLSNIEGKLEKSISVSSAFSFPAAFITSPKIAPNEGTISFANVAFILRASKLGKGTILNLIPFISLLFGSYI
jgi:hypothetical protein